jgi:hypothetical protein
MPCVSTSSPAQLPTKKPVVLRRADHCSKPYALS